MKRFLTSHPSVLLFGIAQVFFSAPGQTFLISLFVGILTTDVGISLGEFAAIYSGATLAASLCLNPAGRLIDRFSIYWIVSVATVSMAVGCLVLSFSSSWIMLSLAIFLLRLFGQGVFGLTASTVFSKLFNRNRGKALGIMTLGFPLSEAIFPALTLALIAAVGWRETYQIFAVLTLCVMLPLQIWFIQTGKINRGHFLPGEMSVQPQQLRGTRVNQDDHHLGKDKSLKQVLKQPTFYALLLASAAPPVVMTSVFFYQDELFKLHQWPISLAASGLMIYAVTKAFGSLVIGHHVDEKGPLYAFVAMILMLGIGAGIAGKGGGTATVWVYMGLMGMALGMSAPVMNVVWATLFGTTHIGSIKGFIGTVRNGLTAMGPLPIAWGLAAGLNLSQLLFITMGIVILLSLIPIVVSRFEPLKW